MIDKVWLIKQIVNLINHSPNQLNQLVLYDKKIVFTGYNLLLAFG